LAAALAAWLRRRRQHQAWRESFSGIWLAAAKPASAAASEVNGESRLGGA